MIKMSPAILASALVCAGAGPVSADVITDWDEKAVALVTPRMPPPATLDQPVANARIWAGFHYRFSTHVGQDMGRKIGKHVVKTIMQPVN